MNRPTRSRSLVVGAFVAVTALACAALVAAAALVPAPAAALPVIVTVCVGLPMVAAYELSTLRAAPVADVGERQLAALRRELARLPETKHPLGL